MQDDYNCMYCTKKSSQMGFFFMPSAFRARISAFRAKIYKISKLCDSIQHVVSKTQHTSKFT